MKKSLSFVRTGQFHWWARHAISLSASNGHWTSGTPLSERTWTKTSLMRMGRTLFLRPWARPSTSLILHCRRWHRVSNFLSLGSIPSIHKEKKKRTVNVKNATCQLYFCDQAALVHYHQSISEVLEHETCLERFPRWCNETRVATVCGQLVSQHLPKFRFVGVHIPFLSLNLRNKKKNVLGRFSQKILDGIWICKIH